MVATAATRGTQAVTAILATIRTQAAVQADETRWPEDGQNGYLWSLVRGPAALIQAGPPGQRMVDALLGDPGLFVVGEEVAACNPTSIPPICAVRPP